MASTSGEFSVVHYFDAEKNELMFVRFWVNGHEVLMPLSELVYGLKDGKDIEVVIPEDTSEENKLVNMNGENRRRMWLFVEKALSKFKNVLYWNSEKNSFSTKELKHS